MTDPDDPRLRLRIWIEGKLVEEIWLDASNPDANPIFAKTLRRHIQLAQWAERVGKRWMVESFDAGKPREQAYIRMGTDTHGMVSPHPPEGEWPD